MVEMVESLEEKASEFSGAACGLSVSVAAERRIYAHAAEVAGEVLWRSGLFTTCHGERVAVDGASVSAALTSEMITFALHGPGRAWFAAMILREARSSRVSDHVSIDVELHDSRGMRREIWRCTFDAAALVDDRPHMRARLLQFETRETLDVAGVEVTMAPEGAIGGARAFTVNNPVAPGRECPMCSAFSSRHWRDCPLVRAAVAAQPERFVERSGFVDAADGLEPAFIEYACRNAAPTPAVSFKISPEFARDLEEHNARIDAASARRDAIKAAVRAIDGVSRCEVDDHGPASARAMTAAVWAGTHADMVAIYDAVAERADGMPFEVKVRLHRMIEMSIEVTPTDQMHEGDADLMSDDWSREVRAELERRARAADVLVQTEVDADVDNFGDAP